MHIIGGLDSRTLQSGLSELFGVLFGKYFVWQGAKTGEKHQMEYAYPIRHPPILLYLVMFSIAVVVEKAMERNGWKLGKLLFCGEKA